jgi:dTDP-4-dehydrorhamnose reductase
LVTGTQGQLARALAACAVGEVEVVARGRPDLDLCDPGSIAHCVAAVQPAVVINAAAYTAVDRAESEPDAAFAANARGAGLLAEAARRARAGFIQISTDYVFDGLKATPYVETDPTGPKGVYGASKLAGETAVIEAHPGAVILRTSWVYSHDGANFLTTMLRLAQTRDAVGVVSDQFGAPTYAPDLAAVSLAIARRLAQEPEGAAPRGVVHATGAGDTSWAGFAAAIFDEARRRGLKSAAVTPIRTEDYPTPAARPANSRLACGKLAEAWGLRLPHWSRSLHACFDRLDAAR